MQESIYETLLQLPLFQGLGRADLTDIVTKVKMDFRRPHDGEVMVRKGEPCRELHFLLGGTICYTHAAAKGHIVIHEMHSSPTVLGSTSLFGLDPTYSYTVTASHDVRTLVVDKQYVIHNLLIYEVCRFNLLNLLSTRVQRQQFRLTQPYETNPALRLTAYLKQLMVHPAGQKTIECKMTDLAQELGETRLTVSHILNQMQNNGLLEIGRGRLHIPAFEKLFK